MPTSQQKLKQQYTKSVDLMASKSRFGFFTLSPSYRAAITDYAQKKPQKDQNGRVKIPQRNFQAGAYKNGKINRQLFSYTPSVFNGDPFKQSLQNIRSTSCGQKMIKDGQQVCIYKPAMLNKTLMSSAYPYIPQKTQNLDPKRNRDEQGRVKTAPRNFVANNYKKIGLDKAKSFKYATDPYDNAKNQRTKQLFLSIQKRGQLPFKRGALGRQFFNSNVQTFNDAEMKKKSATQAHYDNAKITHEKAFVPSCRQNIGKNGMFSTNGYMPQNGKKQFKRVTAKGLKQQTFKLSNKPFSSKPSPSISCSKINLFRKMR